MRRFLRWRCECAMVAEFLTACPWGGGGRYGADANEMGKENLWCGRINVAELIQPLPIYYLLIFRLPPNPGLAPVR